MPHITWKFCLMWISFVVIWVFMVIIPFLKILLLLSQSRFFVDLMKWHDSHKMHPWFGIHLPRDILLLPNSYVISVGYTGGCNLTNMHFVYFRHILYTAVINLPVSLLKILCNLWDFGKYLPINQRKLVATFADTTLLNAGLNQVIIRDLFLVFVIDFWCIQNQLWTHHFCCVVKNEQICIA